MQRFTRQLLIQQKANQPSTLFQTHFIFKNIMMKIQQAFPPDVDALLFTLVILYGLK